MLTPGLPGLSGNFQGEKKSKMVATVLEQAFLDEVTSVFIIWWWAWGLMLLKKCLF